MFAITFDLVVAETEQHHPRGVSAAYADIGSTLRQFAFERVQGSVYITQRDDMANLFAALLALKTLAWFPASVRDIRGFKIENWSDFTPLIKGSPQNNI
jgi:virulence-associated protein VapD